MVCTRINMHHGLNSLEIHGIHTITTKLGHGNDLLSKPHHIPRCHIDGSVTTCFTQYRQIVCHHRCPNVECLHGRISESFKEGWKHKHGSPLQLSELLFVR